MLVALLIAPQPAHAKCAADYAQKERASIRAHYAQQTQQVNHWRDQKIAGTLERYRREYYQESKELLNEMQQERAALAERIRSEDRYPGKQAEYNEEARRIGRGYHKEVNVLKKDHNGRYWQEISSIREEAREMRQSLHNLKEEDVAQLNQHIAKGCKDPITLRSIFERTGKLIKKEDAGPEENNVGGPGIRG